MDDGTLTRERLIREATRLVEHRGFASTSLSDLLCAADVKKGAFYHHFASKDDLCLEVLELEKARFLDWLAALLNTGTPREGLDRFFRAALALHKKRGFVGGCLFGNTALETSDTSPRYAELVKGVFSEWTAKLETVIREGQKASEIRGDVEADVLAQAIVATIEGAIMLSRLQKNELPMKTTLETLTVFLDHPHKAA